MKRMVRDYETPTVPPSWETFSRRWAHQLGLDGQEVVLACSPDRYGNAVVLRLLGDGVAYVATRRSSDADDATTRRENFLRAVRERSHRTIELDVAGYYVGEGAVPCACGAAVAHEEWQHALLRELLRVAEPPAEPAGSLSAEDADDAEQSSLDRRVAELLSHSLL
jgi:hypothetical protein